MGGGEGHDQAPSLPVPVRATEGGVEGHHRAQKSRIQQQPQQQLAEAITDYTDRLGITETSERLAVRWQQLPPTTLQKE